MSNDNVADSRLLEISKLFNFRIFGVDCCLTAALVFVVGRKKLAENQKIEAITRKQNSEATSNKQTNKVKLRKSEC